MSGPKEAKELRRRLAWWARENDRVAVLGPDRGLDHGRLCWDALEPTGLLHPHCGHCRDHGGPRTDRELHERLEVRVPAARAADWMAATLWQDLVFRSDAGPDPRAVADAGELVALLGPDADWRANGHAAHPAPGGAHRGWRSVTECTFDAALVGIGGGYAVVVVAVGED
ncbi:hypothetical protein [Kitasatospora sp. NRRL B-11411]|uniref:hypothetical protein n=1 Tax=Kitasatospora sp. NRRL B-11411 TaxID=1463822 RepID=UPI0004C3C5FD|nr:hypothetical protein [Kitasatospora sp. NRRL B-11411]